VLKKYTKLFLRLPVKVKNKDYLPTGIFEDLSSVSGTDK